MRYRALDAAGDFSFGHSRLDFLVNSPAAVGQAVMTRLKLWRGEWFVDPQDGTPWLTDITGAHTQGVRDTAIKRRILGTRGVLAIANYSSTFDPATRAFIVAATVQTIYGTAAVAGSLSR